jgi:site-specific DNA-methyltransferase (adenine-specific)
MCVRIEDAGFEIRDMIAWVYGSGFPKSLDVSKAIDKAAGAEREVVGSYAVTREFKGREFVGEKSCAASVNITAPAPDAARQWQGWGTALKPALEPITVARKPLVGTVADNVMRYGTGAINVDWCRVGTDDMSAQFDREWKQDGTFGNGKRASQGKQCPPGRWPANLIHDGSDEVVGLFPMTKSGILKAGTKRTTSGGYHGGFPEIATHYDTGGDSGSAARFFYCAKASKRDRDEGLDLPEATPGEKTGRADGSAGINPYAGSRAPTRNIHPTVKPTDLMRYLVRLVTPPGGTVLDPFMGSGSTGKAAVLEGFGFVGIEREERYLDIARARITHAVPEAIAGQLGLF